MRKKGKKNISLFNVLVSIFLTSGILVFFVYNIIHVNSVAFDINNNRTQLEKQVNINNGLQTEIERLTTFENIRPVAIDKLGLSYPKNNPKRITVNKSELETLKQ